MEVTDLCATCGHPEADHLEGLFGVVCGGRDWMDDRNYECGCQEFKRKEVE
jgi:hypothetical protein